MTKVNPLHFSSIYPKKLTNLNETFRHYRRRNAKSRHMKFFYSRHYRIIQHSLNCSAWNDHSNWLLISLVVMPGNFFLGDSVFSKLHPETIRGWVNEWARSFLMVKMPFSGRGMLERDEKISTILYWQHLPVLQPTNHLMHSVQHPADLCLQTAS